MTDRVCSYEGCDRAVKARGWCNTHYEQWRHGRTVTVLRSYGLGNKCEHVFCDRQAQARGMCLNHYATYIRNMNRSRAVTLLGGACQDCGARYPDAIYDFHHLEAEDKAFTLAAFWYRKWETLEPEIQKCVLLCANCHRLRHFSKGTHNNKRVAVSSISSAT